MIFEEVVCVHNLFEAWGEFKRAKLRKQDVQEFSLNLEHNIFNLHQKLKSDQWVADPYIAFYVRDPKLRHIHKASVRDRVLYQAVYRKLYDVFDPHFIHDSYSCRNDKGLHTGFKRLEHFIRKSTKSYNRVSYVLKCDVRKFFDSIDHNILYGLISKQIKDRRILSLARTILASFSKSEGIGLPLGNVTSQLFANIYLNELDQFIKHSLKAKYYARYCDDFVIVDPDEQKLKDFINLIRDFLQVRLKLDLHPNKISLHKVSQGVDFLGFISMSHYNVLRTKTKNRIFRKVSNMVKKSNREKLEVSLPSYLGVLKHTQSQKIAGAIFDKIKPLFKEEIMMYQYIGQVISEFKKSVIAPATNHLVRSKINLNQNREY